MTSIVTAIIANQPSAVTLQSNNSIVTTTTELSQIINMIGNPVALAGSADYLNFNQATPASVWNINHNFGRKPNVSVYTTGGLEVLAEVLHLSNNTAQISLDSALAGFAILS